jgi:hypothetical protein
MILRGLQVEHWRCIGKLELHDLPAGIIVFHGPNRAGKSSLVRAIRLCLFDADHDVGGKEFKKNVPWGSTESPRVVAEFQTQGVEYRLTKVFSKRVDGKAVLERKAGSNWQLVEDAPKEASRKVRELLGADASTGGLNQLLWLEQGEIGLPSAKELDATLEKQLVTVLGMLVTGGDLAFKRILDDRCGCWFTAGSKPKKGSPVSGWGAELEKRQAERKRTKEKFEELEQSIRRLEDCEDELPKRQRAVEDAKKEFEQLEAERTASSERRRQYVLAEQAESAACRWRDGEMEVEEAAKKVKASEDEQGRLLREHRNNLRELSDARSAEEGHLRGREELDDRRKLLGFSQQRSQLVELLNGVQKLEEEIAQLEQWLENEAAPDKKTLEELRGNRRQAQGLRAQLQASGLAVEVTVCRPLQISLVLDGQPAQPVDLLPGEKRAWSLRQRAAINIPDLATVALARSQESVDLEVAARELETLDRDYQEAVRIYKEDPSDEACLDRLAERRIQRENKASRLKKAREELREKAPQGRGALEGQRDLLDNQRQLVLQRRPDLADWQPTAADFDDREQNFNNESAELAALRKARESAEKQAREDSEEAETPLQQRKEELAGARAAARASREEVQRMEEETTLLPGLEKAREAVAKAERRLAECQLTQAEQTVEERCAAASTALDTRRQRLRVLENELNMLIGVLRGNEGLHTRLADAETAVHEAAKQLAHETLEAQAHQRLQELFEASREIQVQQVMDPIAGRVLDWAKKVGLESYREVRFGDSYFPQGILLQTGELNVPANLEDESYGTAEQLSLLVRLALGGVLAKDEPAVAIFDDPLAHADPIKHRRTLDILRVAAEGMPALVPPAGPLQILIFTCHPDRFDHIPGARHIDLAKLIMRGT